MAESPYVTQMKNIYLATCEANKKVRATCTARTRGNTRCKINRGLNKDGLCCFHDPVRVKDTEQVRRKSRELKRERRRLIQECTNNVLDSKIPTRTNNEPNIQNIERQLNSIYEAVLSNGISLPTGKPPRIIGVKPYTHHVIIESDESVFSAASASNDQRIYGEISKGSIRFICTAGSVGPVPLDMSHDKNI
jgi:hypothetical protein